MKFRKKPIVVDAVLWQGGEYDFLETFCGRNWGRADVNMVDWSSVPDKEQVVVWNTAERQWLQVPVGHWIIRGIDGELYPCRADIFDATYEKVEP